MLTKLVSYSLNPMRQSRAVAIPNRGRGYLFIS